METKDFKNSEYLAVYVDELQLGCVDQPIKNTKITDCRAISSFLFKKN